MGLLKCTYRSLRNFLIFFAVVALPPFLPPKLTFDVTSYRSPKSLPLEGPLAVNTLLENAQRWLEGRVHGPETIIVRGDDIYVSLVDEVVRLNGDHITHVAKFGKPCDVSYEPEICGRPLGVAFDTISENLIVADGYYGIFIVDVKTGKKTQLVSPEDILPGEVERPAKTFNSLALSSTGDIYWTDSSSDYTLVDGLLALFSNPSGRLFKYNRATKTNTVLHDRLHFANGIVLSPKEDFLIVAETALSTLTRVYLTGELAGTSDTFIEGLTGFPDNLTPDKDGLWVPLVQSHNAYYPALWQSASEAPLIRRFILRFFYLLEQPFRLAERVYPSVFAKRALKAIGGFDLAFYLTAPHNTIIRMSWNGEVVGSLHGTSRTTFGIAHVAEYKGKLLLGSYVNNYIATVPIPLNLRPAPIPTTTTTTTARPTTTTTTTTTARPTTTTTTERPTTTTTRAPPTTTTAAPTTTTTTTTTTAAPTTTTTTAAPTTTTTTTTAAPPTTAAPTTTTTTTAAPTTTPEAPAKPIEKPAQTPKDPAPIVEIDPNDSKTPQPEKLKIIRKGGEQGEF